MKRDDEGRAPLTSTEAQAGRQTVEVAHVKHVRTEPLEAFDSVAGDRRVPVGLEAPGGWIAHPETEHTDLTVSRLVDLPELTVWSVTRYENRDGVSLGEPTRQPGRV